MKEIVSHALAKVNLILNITEKSENGYHKMQSIFAFLENIYDELIFYPDMEFNRQSGVIDGLKSNSIHDAHDILKKTFGSRKIPHVIIKKNIPIGGGLGGGSSDSACFVNTVFDLWGFSNNEKLSYLDLFNSLGSDAKVFLFKYFTKVRFVYLDGVGFSSSDLTEIDLKDTDGKEILVINNNTKLSTFEVFKKFSNSHKLSSRINISDQWPNEFLNSLEPYAISLEHSLRFILNDLQKTKATLFGVSGSGTSCFAIYSGRQDAMLAVEKLQDKYAFVKLSNF